MSEVTERRICSVCSDPIEDGEDVHYLHLPDCIEGCVCDRPCHAGCCPEVDCQGVAW